MARVEAAQAIATGPAPQVAQTARRGSDGGGAPAKQADFWRVSLLSLGHGGSDMYSSILNPILPLFYLSGRLSLTEAGLVTLVSAVSSSMLQPVFGYISDRTGRRSLVYLGPAWVAICISLVGLAPSTFVFILLALMSGIGSAAFHPQASSMVNSVSGNQRAMAMSVFQLGGNVGFALGPVLVAYLSSAGVEHTVQFMPIGLIVATLLFFWAPTLEHQRRASTASGGPSLWDSVRPHRKGLSLVVAVVALRTAVTSGLLIVFPLYLKNHGMEFSQAQFFSSVVLAAGSFGAMGGSWVADRLGYRAVMVAALLATSPVLAVFAYFHPIGLWVVFAALIGVAIQSSSSLSIVMAQAMLPRNTGIAAGLTLGFGFGLGGVCSAMYTITADHLGLNVAVTMLVLTPLVAALAAWAIPTRRAEA